MPSFSIQEDYPAINAAANAFLNRLSGTHIETDIAGAASVAGKLLDPDIGKSLAMSYLVASSKTVPYPLPDGAAA